MIIRPYGDTLDDGAIQLSFTLPMPCSPRALDGAKLLLSRMGLENCQVVHTEPAGEEFTFVVAYASTRQGFDPEEIQIASAIEDELMEMEQVNDFIREKIGRRLVVVGACTGSDAHTVGIDAIMNMKGCNHHYGLERYSEIDAHNLGAQVENEELIQRAVQLQADAILISQIVTQKDVHIRNLTRFIELLEAQNLRHRFLCIVGGPRINHKLAIEIGFDAGFGRGSYAEHVATHIARTLARRQA